MPNTQSNTARQLAASFICATVLQKQLNSTKEVTQRVAAHRQQYVDRMASLIHDWIEHQPPPPTEAKAWRDAWCHDCDINDAFLGTLAQHAARVFDAGWKIEGGLNGNLLVCPTCQEVK
jgi:hypothetical protein